MGPKLSKGGGADMGSKKSNESKTSAVKLIERSLKELKGDVKGSLKPFLKKRKEKNTVMEGSNVALSKVSPRMGGGMMQKPMSYDDGGRVKNTRGISAIRPRGPAGRAASGPRKMDDILKEMKKFTDSDSGVIIVTKDRDKVKKMGGGMMQKPMGYKSGKSIKVACKLGRNKPTKMY